MVGKIITVLYLLLLLGLFILNAVWSNRGYGAYLAPITYWTILVGWVTLIYKKRLNAKFTLNTAFLLFLVSASIYVLNKKDISEIIMKISFIGWLIGIIQTLFEYKKGKSNSL